LENDFLAPDDLAFMRLIDELHLNFPFAGSRMLRDLLRLAGFTADRQRGGPG
jgi:putative transposase